jgi:GNAT superfamily N-acetyltransferase
LKDHMSRANTDEELLDLAYESSSVKFYEIADVSSIEFEEAMTIYVESFPENERRPVATIKMMLISRKSHLITGRMENETVFMALLYPLKGTSFLLGDYLATAKRYRGRGIGKMFLRSIFDVLDDIQFKYFLIQVDNPYLNRDEMKIKILEFYKKLGAKELKGIRYILPPLQGTAPTELILMVLSTVNDDYLTGESVRQIIIQMFGELYDRHEGDEFLTSILGGTPDRVWLE